MTRNLGQQTERRILKKIDARRQPMSGAIPGFPNDGVKGRYLIEVKSTQRRSLGLKREWLETLEENAMTCGKAPAFIIIFNSDVSGPSFRGFGLTDEWVAIPRKDFEKLTKGWAKS